MIPQNSFYSTRSLDKQPEKNSTDETYKENITLQQQLQLQNPQISQTLSKNQFQKLKSLGRGSEGQVILCNLQKKIGYSIPKIIKIIHIKSKKAKKKFLYNYQLQIDVNNGVFQKRRHVITAERYFFSLSQNYAFKVYNYESSLSLYQLLKYNRNVFEKQPKLIRKLVMHLSLALLQIHSSGVIHCDLKPDNILLIIQPTVKITKKHKIFDSKSDEKSIQNSDYIPINFKAKQKFIRRYHISQLQFKVIDFGHSSRKDSVAKIVPLTQFSAPEIIRSQNYGYCSDIWSMGMVIFYVLSKGDLPYHGETIEQFVENIRDHQAFYPDGIMISSDLKQFICKCLQSKVIEKKLKSQHKSDLNKRRDKQNARWDVYQLLKHDFITKSQQFYKLLDPVQIKNITR